MTHSPPAFHRMARALPDTAWALLALLAVDLLLLRDPRWWVEQGAGLRWWVNALLSLWVLWALLGLVRGRAAWPWAGRALLALLWGLGAYAQSAYFAVYRKAIGVFDLRFFAADPAMALQLYADNAAVARPLAAGVLSAGVLWCLMSRPRPVEPGRRALWVLGGQRLGAMAVLLLLCVNWYSSPNLQLHPVGLLTTGVRTLDIRVGKNADAPIRKPEVPTQAAMAGAPDLVFVIGESLNRGHMGLYGYGRDTTPQLRALQDRGEVLAFDNVVSIGPRTMVSVPYMLVGLQGIDPHGLIYSAPTVFNYAKRSGYRTALITAQDFQWRNIDRLFVDADLDHFRQGSDFSSRVNVSVGADDHQVLERGVAPWLRSVPASQPLLLVTQMSGSHPPFAQQVPPQAKRFGPETHPNSIEAYDNTVHYTDAYLGRLLALVRQQRPGAWVFFTSDHGQHVTGQGGMFHGDLSDEIIRVPLLVFPPAGQAGRVQAERGAPLSQADVMATALALMGRRPMAPLDGLNLLEPVPADRLRVSTAYVKTLHNDPVAAVVLPDGRRYEVQFDNKSVIWDDGKTVKPLSELPQKYRELFDRRLAPGGNF